jgi:hypothetical protein
MTIRKRLENIDQLQWELDAWRQYAIAWSEDEDIGEAAAERAQALSMASRLLTEVFGDPDPEERP